MARQTTFLAFGIACLLFCVTTAVIVLLNSPANTPQEPSAEMWASLLQIEERLDLLEEKLDSLGQKSSFSDPLALLDPADGNNGDDGEEFTLDEDDQERSEESRTDREAVLAKIDSLDRRIRSLEADPIQRGYNYIGSQSPELRRQGILALERIAKDDPEAMAAIRQMLLDPDAGVRRTTLDTLADLENKDSIPEILPLLFDSDVNVRREAITTLSRLEASEAGPQIGRLLEDPDARVREQAADALGKLKFGGGTDILFQALKDPSERVRGEAIASLGEIGARNAVPHLREMYEKNPGEHRYRLVRALRNLGDLQPFQQEIGRLSNTALSDENESARSRAIRTLGWFARDEAQDVLKKIAQEDASNRVRREAERLLRNRRPEEDRNSRDGRSGAEWFLRG